MTTPDGGSKPSDRHALSLDAPPLAELSLHEKILAEFACRLRAHEHVGDELASAVALILRGPKMPKRDAIVETMRNALAAKAEADGSTS